MPDGQPSLLDQQISARRERVREDEPLIAQELFAATFTGVTPPSCACEGCERRACGLDAKGRPICDWCARLPECDLYEGPSHRELRWQEASDLEWRDG